MKAFLIMGRVIKASYEELFLVVGLSVAWWAGTLLIVTAPMTTAGVQNVTNRIANYKRSSFDFFWSGARAHIGRGVLLFLILLFAPPLVGFSINFYFQQQGWLVLFGVVMAWVLLILLMGGQYCFPLFWQQNEPDLKLIIRNGLLLAVRHPLYSILMLLFQGVLIVLSFALVVPVMLLLPGMIALSQNFALVGLLQEMDLAPQPPEMSGT
jgi:protein-S-isoprenylcysteine O-methyltransferase Ste14